MERCIKNGIPFTRFLAATSCLCLLLFTSTPGASQENIFDTALAQQILQRVASMQVSKQGNFYPGMFPSYREYHRNPGRLKDDNNIFFTGLVNFTLRNLQPSMDPVSKRICDSIFVRSSAAFKYFKNTKGKPSYNFWQKDPPIIFPNSGWLNLFNRWQALADDLDDTAILLLAMNADDSTAGSVHQLMQNYTNTKKKRAKGSLKDYQNMAAYSTWFGEKMPIDLDVCVLTNALYLVNQYHLPYSLADSASLEFICKVVKTRHYIDEAAIVSPHYNRTPVIIYHITRLMAQRNLPCLEQLKPQLIADAKVCYKNSSNFLDRIILSTSLLRLGIVLPDETFTIDTKLESFTENNDFVFFIANMASMFGRPLNRMLGKSGVGKFYYYCPAWNEVLLLENMVLRQSRR